MFEAAYGVPTAFLPRVRNFEPLLIVLFSLCWEYLLHLDAEGDLGKSSSLLDVIEFAVWNFVQGRGLNTSLKSTASALRGDVERQGPRSKAPCPKQMGKL